MSSWGDGHRTHLEAEGGGWLSLPASGTFCGSAGNSGAELFLLFWWWWWGDDNKVSRNTLSLRSPAPACSRYLSGTSETQPPKQILSPCMSVAALLAGTQTHNEWLLKTPYPLFPFGECASVVSERSSTCSRPSLGGFLFTGVVSH